MTTEADTPQIFYKLLGHNLRHDPVSVVDALAALKAQREREHSGEAFRSAGVGGSVIGV